ncbi:hypothetical protein AUEXF2481DRAFT_32956 [Aureobasidium subglaciale EXF-2481]|uniref:Cryptic loci regulator 2 N-terminal domain-containing protein n=1 Tax=Aureobasidium subglaciale (strain EXF-2481) TaxID=1043005 RepID=A0A074Y1H0_AURSE|nr:uncharacterized protein AUEXF2481DRAFT_32956 [Aureobasidium subglaciale EXF-2481]KEQ91575.1 hypothetical protein AUEXF2481DRAFT_32956 [Aureobasidium subglaciale EXF-2481]
MSHPYVTSQAVPGSANGSTTISDILKRQLTPEQSYLPVGATAPFTIFLELLPSDGNGIFLHNGNPSYQVLDPDSEGKAFETRGLPTGYHIEYRITEHDDTPTKRDIEIYGHPSGYYFKSFLKFGAHLAALMKEDLQGCNCDLCQQWHRKAPIDAAIRVGLPRVPGGAMAAAINITVDQQIYFAAIRITQDRPIQQAVAALELAGDVEDTEQAVAHMGMARMVDGLPDFQKKAIDDLIAWMRGYLV